jgi:FixJ family two-component response regulator
MTGHFSVAMATLALGGGALDILEKPICPKILVAALDRAARELEEDS